MNGDDKLLTNAIMVRLVFNARANIKADIADTPARFKAIRLNESAKCDAPEELSKLVIFAELGCNVANTFRAAVEHSVKVV
jgi:hypothetical protein